jgi:PhnB protein
MSKPNSPPPAQTTVTPYIVVKGAAEAIDFYKAAFGAVEDFRLTEPGGGKIGHAEMLIGSARFMLADEWPDFGALSPTTIGGTAVRLHLLVENTGATMDRAVAAGAILLRPAKDQFFGERTGLIADPFGHEWFIASRIAEVTPQEMQRRWNESFR